MIPVITLGLGPQITPSKRPQIPTLGVPAEFTQLMGRFQTWLDRQSDERLRLAFNTAIEVHKGQTRMSPEGLPYIYHPVGVALWIIGKGIEDPEIICAALLHDTHEDRPKLISLDDIEKAFGKRVRNIVESLTNPEWPPMDQASWNKAYADHVTDAIKDDDILLVKLADFFKNAAKLKYTAREGKSGRSAKSAVKYLPLIPVFQARIPESKYRWKLSLSVARLGEIKAELEQIIADDRAVS